MTQTRLIKIITANDNIHRIVREPCTGETRKAVAHKRSRRRLFDTRRYCYYHYYCISETRSQLFFK